MKKSHQELKKLPTTSIFDFSRVGLIPVIYFLLDDVKRCYYVGKAERFKERLNKHKSLGNLHKFQEAGATQIAWWHCPEPHRLEEHENEWIKILKTPWLLNQKLNNLKESSSPAPSSLLTEETCLEFIQLKVQARKAEAQAKKLDEAVISYIETYGKQGTQIYTPLGKIVKSQRPTWGYSDATQKLAYQLKQQQQYERDHAIATIAKSVTYPAAYPEQCLLE